jgi:hypothetical protein|uniref:Uncharacterized protein n=1 Tax=viral metagenome TaxID=1070528 RepID=A0A6C0LXH3_9ZZZZ
MTTDLKPPEFFSEKYKNNKISFFSLLDRVQKSFIAFKQDQENEDAERLYRGYVARVGEFHVNEKKVDVEFAKNNNKANIIIDQLTKVIEDDKKTFSTLTREYNSIKESNNSFEQTYSDSVYNYNYQLLYGTSLIGMVILMVISAK